MRRYWRSSRCCYDLNFGGHSDALAALQLVYAGKTQGLEFETVWIVGEEEGRCALPADYGRIAPIALRFIPDQQSQEQIDKLKSRGAAMLLQVGTVMIRKSLLETPAIGVLNLHAGMLPRYRGLDSAMWAVPDGAAHGVTAHMLAAGFDTGSIALTEEVPLMAGESVRQLLGRTHNRHIWQLFVRAACGLRDGSLKLRPPQPKDSHQYFAMHPRLAAVAQEMLIAGIAIHHPGP